MTDTNGNGKPGLHAALIKARAAIGAIPKTATNPLHNSKYAPLGEVLAHVNPALHANDLCFTSGVIPSPDGPCLLSKVVYAPTGEVEDCTIPLLPGFGKGGTVLPLTPQGLKAACTYAQRTALEVLLALELDDDDDGNAATASASRAAGVGARKPQAVKPSPSQAPAATDPHATISPERVKKLVAFRETLGVALMQSPHATIPAAELTNAMADEIGHWHVDRVKAARAFSAPPAPHEEPEEVQGETASAGGAGDELVFPDAPKAPAYHATPGTLTAEEQDKLAAAKKRRAEKEARAGR